MAGEIVASAGTCKGGPSSWGSSFIDFTTRSPATDEAHRLRDSELSDDMVLESIEPPEGKPFKVGGACCWEDNDFVSTFMSATTGADSELTLQAAGDDEEPGPRD